MSDKRRMGACVECGRMARIQARKMCSGCYNRKRRRGEMEPLASLNRRLSDDWWHFQGFLGRYWAIQHLADTYQCSPSAIREWVRAHDPGPIEEPVAA